MTPEFVALDEPTLLAVHRAASRDLVGAYLYGEIALRHLLAVPDDWRGAMLLRNYPVMAWGLVPYWPGRAEAWMLVSHELTQRETAFGVNAARDQLFRLQAQHPAQLHRVEMYCDASAPWRDAFALRLGMTLEGIHPGWGPDGNAYASFARIAGGFCA